MDFEILFFPARDDAEHALAMHTIPEIVQRFGPAGVGMVAPADVHHNARKAASHAEIVRLLASRSVPVMNHLAYIGQSSDRLERRCNELRELGVTGVFAMKGWERMVPEEGSPREPAYACTSDFVASLQRKFTRVCATCYVEGHHLRRRTLPTLTSAAEAAADWWAVDDVGGARIGIPRAELVAGIDVDVQKARAGVHALVANMVYSHELFFAFRELAVQRGLSVPIVPEVYVGNSRAEFDKRFLNEGFVAPASLRYAIESAACDEEVQALWVAHAVELCRHFLAGGVASIYLSAPKGRAAELFLTRCRLESILKKHEYTSFAVAVPLRKISSAPSLTLGNTPSIHQHYFLSGSDEGGGAALSGAAAHEEVEHHSAGSEQQLDQKPVLARATTLA
jgi:5,10-methylenetetrahydrofolate reductase